LQKREAALGFLGFWLYCHSLWETLRDVAAAVCGGCRLASLQLAAALPATSSTDSEGWRRFLLSVSCRELQAGSSLRSPDIRELYWGV